MIIFINITKFSGEFKEAESALFYIDMTQRYKRACWWWPNCQNIKLILKARNKSTQPYTEVVSKEYKFTMQLIYIYD